MESDPVAPEKSAWLLMSLSRSVEPMAPSNDDTGLGFQVATT